jgi:hypothetical protein
VNRRRFRGDLSGSLMVPVGWLFADLLLALAMLFLAANTFGTPPKPTPVVVKATPTPTATPSPTPTPVALLLEPGRITLTLTSIDPDKLRVGDAGAVADLKRKIADQINAKGLQHRRAGIAVAYGGADDYSQAQVATDVAVEVYRVLDMLGQQKFVFCNTVHYDPLFTTLHPHDTVVIDIYFFRASVGGC